MREHRLVYKQVMASVLPVNKGVKMKPTITFKEDEDVAVLTCSQEDMIYVLSLMAYTTGKRFTNCMEEHTDLVEEGLGLYEQVVEDFSAHVKDDQLVIHPFVAFKEVGETLV